MAISSSLVQKRLSSPRSEMSYVLNAGCATTDVQMKISRECLRNAFSQLLQSKSPSPHPALGPQSVLSRPTQVMLTICAESSKVRKSMNRV
ncbi:hypothetical protein Plhal304r1_c049g0130921 [Plasmopara halstedii]